MSVSGAMSETAASPPSPMSSSSSSSGSAKRSTAATTPGERAYDDEHFTKELNGTAEELAKLITDAETDTYNSYLPRVPDRFGGKQLEPLPIDAGTPDAWIARDERMVRLTGKHPYNVEAPLEDLWKAGFLTPQSLFYVRSHGATPHVSSKEAKEWRVHIHGLVEKEVSFTVEELKERFETVTLPVTLVCAGNRRKEQNMVTKGLGFNWGAAGVSTGLFTGVYLADVLEYCKPKRPAGAFPYGRKTPGRARHVIFEGADELPKGKYGTSQRLQWAADRSKGMLLAWGLNGEALSPDHGFPLRLVVPGQIGGRMVKWLNRIEVSEEESQHYLHFWDNKFLPTTVTADQARAEEKWWYDPKYIINDLNVNAAITVPAHDQKMAIEDDDEMVKVAGYAYTGGGKRVHRVEITLDDGKSWTLCELDWPEDKYRIAPIRNHPFFGTLDLTETEMSFTWCFWETYVRSGDLRKSTCLAARATDEGLAQMPRDMYWNAMSMMNNWWFRVAIHKEQNELRFEHPTQAGNAQGGWMQRFNEEGRSNRYPDFAPVDGDAASGITTAVAAPAPRKEKVDVDALMRDEAKTGTVITSEQLAEHANETSPWFVVNGHVFDGTAFLEKHPGGAESITLVAGEDASEDFMAIHSIDAKKQMRDFHVGKLAEGAGVAAGAEVVDTTGEFLNPKQWRKSKLVAKTQLSHDSAMFRFALDREDQRVGLPIGQHVYIRVKDADGNFVQRAYTPFSGNEQLGYLDVLIKVYAPCTQFPQGGKMTCVLDTLKVGEGCVELKGPLGHFIYEPGSLMRIHKHPPRRIRNVAMIAGGSGITPIWSTLQGLLQDQEAADTRIWILDANRTEADILARQQIDQLIANRGAGPNPIKLWHILSAEDLGEGWSMGRGRVNVECLREHLPPAPEKKDDEHGHPIEDTIALLCGPPAMEEVVLQGLQELGWDTSRNVVRF